MTPPASPGGEAALAAALAALAAARARTGALHLPGARDAHRAELLTAIQAARAALAQGLAAEAHRSAQRTLGLARAAQALDARYGAGQLSRGAQRAPTRDDCEDGWARVAEIVATAEAASWEATQLAEALGEPELTRAAAGARAAAHEARRIVEERNHAYTFHADPGFSFGEGWYLAAAAVLDGVAIQVEPDKPQTRQVARFIADAGLDGLTTPYRPRPRANKHLPDIVARAFRADPDAAQARLRAAFLGPGPLSPAVVAWAQRGLMAAPYGKKVLLWVRYARHHPDRNTSHAELSSLAARVVAAGMVPVLVGDALREGPAPEGAVDWTLFWRQAVFQGEDMRRAQLELFEYLRRDHGLVGQVGVTTAGMDGPALMGLPTVYLTAEPNVRLGRWVGAVPGYEEVVRGEGYLARVEAALRRWAVM
jgi:hypothetical protein